jgi:hypothetical protein
MTNSEMKLEQPARRVARRVGLLARKSRKHVDVDNRGGFMLVDPKTNGVVFASRYEMTPVEVIEYCEGGSVNG